MKRRRRILLALLGVLIVVSCVFSLIFGLPAIAHQVDNIIQSGPGAIITAIFSIATIYYCVLPLLGLILFVLFIWLIVKYFA
jgi:hypothetical protein